MREASEIPPEARILLSVIDSRMHVFGCRILAAADGADAVAVYARHRNEIGVLTDIMMPVMDGPSEIHALINPKIKIIAASDLNANAALPNCRRPLLSTS